MSGVFGVRFFPGFVPNRESRRSAGTALGTFCLLVASGLFSPILRSEQSKPSEYQVKAAYLYNFSRFVAWPPQAMPSPGEPFAICIFGKDPFGPVLDATLAGESVDGRNQVARRISKPQDALGCRILFVSVSEERRLPEILAVLEKMSVLTVSDIPNFSQRGGMIQFIAEGGKVRFAVNLTNAMDAGLMLSSDLLKVAASVIGNAHGD